MDELKKILFKNLKNRKLFYLSNETISYLDLVKLTKIIIKNLNKNCVGNRVGILFDHGPLYASSLLGSLISKSTAVLMTKSWTNKEFNKIIKTTDTNFILSDETQKGFKLLNEIDFLNYKIKLLKKIKSTNIKSKSKDDLIIFSSGTTQKAKGVLLSKKSIVKNAHAVCSYLKLNKKDVSLIYTPTCYAFSLSQTITHLMAGASLFAAKRMLPMDVVSNILNYKVTGLTGPPAGFENLNNFIKKPIRSIRYCQVGGTPFYFKSYKKLKKNFPKAVIFNVYGCTENSPRVSYLKIQNLKKDLDDDGYFGVGKNVKGTIIKIKKENKKDNFGEIIIKGISMFHGYWNNKTLYKSKIYKSFFKTGDIGYFRNKRLFLLGRKDFSINVGNEKVFPEEIENIAKKNKNVLDVVVYSKKDIKFGKNIIMDVKTKNQLNIDNLKFFMRKYLSEYKIPKIINKTKIIKRNLYGKIDRKFYAN